MLFCELQLSLDARQRQRIGLTKPIQMVTRSSRGKLKCSSVFSRESLPLAFFSISATWVPYFKSVLILSPRIFATLSV